MKKKAWNWGGDWILKQKAEQLFIIMHVSKEVSELCNILVRLPVHSGRGGVESAHNGIPVILS